MRYLPLTDADRAEMLGAIGAASVDDLFVDIPADLRLKGPIEGIAPHASEMAVDAHLSKLAARNISAGQVPFFLGAGAYRHHIPATVDHLIQRGEFLTAYTPYQPEIAQGTLQVLFEFQTQVARLFGTDIANASMYDGSTACWEAIQMAARLTRRRRIVISGGLHAHYVEVARTMARFTRENLEVLPPTLSPEPDDGDVIAAFDEETACAVVQYPDVFGRIPDLSEIAKAVQAKGGLLVVVVTEPVALGLLEAPGALGADIVVGEGQALGVGLQFGGPYLGLFGCREKFVRQMPGRVCGETVDAEGKRGFVLTLSTREQHIRREKATSNICTNSGLCALAFSIHMTLLGGEGLSRLAAVCHAQTRKLTERLTAISGVSALHDAFFNEVTILLPVNAREAVRKLADRGVLGGVAATRLYPGKTDLENAVIVAATELTSDQDIEDFAGAMEEVLV